MCLKLEYVYFSQLHGCILSPWAHILHCLTQAGHNCLMVMTVPSVYVLHRSPQSFSETSIHLKLCLCGCQSWRLHNSAPLEPTGDSCLQSFMMLAVQKPEVSFLPHASLRPSFLKCAGHHDIAAMQNFCTKYECCATRWNLPACGFRIGLFLSMQGTIPGACVLVLLFLCWPASAMRVLQCLLDYAYLWGTQNRLVRLVASLLPQMRSQLPCAGVLSPLQTQSRTWLRLQML